MLGKKSRPVIGKLAGTLGSDSRTRFTDAVTSPRSPLDFKIQSPRGLKNYDLSGVGLGIVAALEKSNDIQANNKAVFGQNLTRSNPIPVKPADTNSCGSRYRGGGGGGGLGEMELDDLEEDYTFVTCHGPNKSYTTRVYCDGGAEYGRVGHDGIGFDRRRGKNHSLALFDISPARFGEDLTAYPASDFLSCCHMCHKKLHGKDIYMYRGEKAFCSTECRYRQIVMDERKEQQCSSEAASRSSSSSAAAVDVSISPYSNGQIFSTGILAI